MRVLAQVEASVRWRPSPRPKSYESQNRIVNQMRSKGTLQAQSYFVQGIWEIESYSGLVVPQPPMLKTFHIRVGARRRQTQDLGPRAFILYMPRVAYQLSHQSFLGEESKGSLARVKDFDRFLDM